MVVPLVGVVLHILQAPETGRERFALGISVKGQHRAYCRAQKRRKRIIGRAGLSGVRPHDLRKVAGVVDGHNTGPGFR